MRIEPKKIMCAIDFSDFTNSILSYGNALASEFGATLILCHVVPGTLMVSSLGHSYFAYTDIESDRIRYAEKKFEKIAGGLDLDCEIMVKSGHAADEITRVARENNVDMVIAATHGGSGVKRFLIGSVTNRLMKTLPCPLLVLHAADKEGDSPDHAKTQLKKILVGCDFSKDSKLAFDYALSLAQEFQTQIYLAHVVGPMEYIGLTGINYLKAEEGDDAGWTRSEYLDLLKTSSGEDLERRSHLLSHLEKQLLAMVPEESRNWCTPATILLEGQPYKELISYAAQKEVDMVVLGVHGHNLLEEFLVGSTTDRVISQASCPVLVVRQKISVTGS